MNLINKKENIFGDDIAFVEYWDFSTANLSMENRIKAITTVASICYQNPKAVGKESLYNRLLAESHGLPSSSFEFVPVLLDPKREPDKILLGDVTSNIRKYGEWVTAINDVGQSQEFLLTNYRALIYDYESKISYEWDAERLEYYKSLYLDWFNNEFEAEIIKKYFKVFLFKVDFPTRSQMVRHRVSWQELSRRYVSGERVPFEYYVSDKMKNVLLCDPTKNVLIKTESGELDDISFSANNIINLCQDFYYQALSQGIKPQEARRIIPQAAYTQIWGAFQPTQLANYFKLRDDEHAQWEIRQTAIAMRELINVK